MSDGGILKGQTFWATIKMHGQLSQDELLQSIEEVRVLLSKKGRNGDLVHATRTYSQDTPVISISMKESKAYAKKRKGSRKPKR